MPRYVILEHDHPELHWDFMLEAGDVLKTWRLADRPRAGQPVRAEPSFDHRQLYLDYEGPVSGNRGTVTAWDRGTYEGEAGELGEGRVVVKLTGERLRGTVTLERGKTGQWGWRFTEEG
jgi:DNA polymerase Ligase (LigD)